MKKILILIMAALIIPISFINLKANENDQFTIYYENVSLIDRITTFTSGGVPVNMTNYESTGYAPLNMGAGHTVNLDLSNLSNILNYYDEENVSSVVLDFTLSALYTGVIESNQQWLSTNPDWEISTQSIELDPESIPDSLSVQFWWNIIGQSGGGPSSSSGNLRFYGVKLIVTYTEPIYLYETVINFSQIPETNGEYTLVQFIPNLNGTFKALFHALDETVYMIPSMALPNEVGTPSDAIYYTENGYHYMIFTFNSDPNKPVDYSLINNDWLVWNLDTGAWELTKNYTIHGKAYGSGNGIFNYNNLYVDLIIPFNIEDLLSVTFNYQYRHHYFLGDPGDWQTVTNQTLMNGEKSSSGAFPWWTNYVALYFRELSLASYLSSTYIKQNQITDITEKVDSVYKSEYITYMQENGTGTYTVNSVFMPNFKAYKIFLGQFDKLGSNGIEAKDIAIVNMRVVVSGNTEIELNYPRQDIVDTGIPNVPNITPDFDVLKTVISQALQWLLSNPAVALIVLLIGAKWIYPLFMDAYEGIDKVGKIVRKLATPRGILLGLIIVAAYYFFVR